MSALLDLQKGIQAYVLGEATTPPESVAATRRASAESRLRVYAEAVRLRFLEVLGEDYPGVRGLLGEDEFARLGRAYAAASPSRHPSIRWFGRHLPEFLRRTSPWREQPVLGEMAAFEWAKSELLDAADGPAVTVEEIAAVPAERWAEIRPRLASAVRRLSLDWNAPALWHAIDKGESPPSPTRLTHPVDWLLWRQDIRIRWRSVDPDEAWALRAAAGGREFGLICSGLCERVGADAAAFRGATYLKQWATDGLLAGI